MKSCIKAVILTLAIFWVIGFGVTLNNNDYTFLGYFNMFFGGLAIYHLSRNYMKEKKK